MPHLTIVFLCIAYLLEGHYDTASAVFMIVAFTLTIADFIRTLVNLDAHKKD